MNGCPPLLISVCGLARSGKNTFCDLARKELENRFNFNCCQLSFAEQLKKDVQNFMDFCNLSISDNIQKELFRPFLSWYGDLRRKQSNGLYFLDIVRKQFEQLGDQYDCFFIPDLRYKFFEYDELDWCQKNGVVVHLSKYTIPNPSQPNIKLFDSPPNELEAKNDPILKNAANYLIEWEHSDGNTNKLQPYIVDFVDFFAI